MSCTAITRGGNVCTNVAKHGTFCGIHRTDKSNICQGITKCGNSCRRTVKRGQFCNVHLFPEEPDHDWAELSLYKPDVNWPNMKQVMHHISKQSSGKELGSLMESQNRIFGHINDIFGFSIPLTPEQEIKQNNSHLIVKMQTFFVNYYLDYSADHWQNIIRDLSYKSDGVSFLKEYRKLFRKKFDLSFREETKQNYIETVLTRSELGKDVAKKIINFM